MTQEEYIILYGKFLSGSVTPEETEMLTRYKDEFDLSRFDDGETIPDQKLIRDRIYVQIQNKMRINTQPKPIRRLWWSVAASFLLLSSMGLYLVNKHTSKGTDKTTQFVKAQKPIVPGTNKAILILGNGDTVNLDQTGNGRIAQAGKMVINKMNNGKLAYEKKGSAINGEDKISFNTIMTPRGGQYQVTLPDGTSVWLNSASSLRYPTSFTGAERHVELKGEAYFEVAKNKDMPFTVNAGRVDVKVLGTHFNIAAYSDDASSKTTLLEGAIRLTKNDQQVILTPGQQAISANEGPKLVMKTVNAEDAIAWKNGYFSFRKETLECAMRKIARWYDVEVEYQGKMSDKILGGSVLRTESINEVLKILESTEIAKFKIVGRRIMVKAN
nr:FecR family protein [Mucilaginibacter sp. L294]